METFESMIEQLDTGEWGTCLTDYYGSVRDAMNEAAEGGASKWPDDLDEYARKHPEQMARAAAGDAIVAAPEYFDWRPNNDWRDYARYVAHAAWALANRDDIAGRLRDCVAAAILEIVAAEFGPECDPDAWEAVERSQGMRWDDESESVSKLVDDAVAAYGEALEAKGGRR